MDYDVLIPVATKDLPVLPYCLRSIANLNPQPKDVYFVTPAVDAVKAVVGNAGHVLHDRDVCAGYGEGKRPEWFQKTLKMFQSVTRDAYLTLDVDVMLPNTFDVFSPDGRPYLSRLHYAQPDRAYTKWLQKAFDIKRPYLHSYVAHHMFFYRDIWQELLALFLDRHPNKTDGSDLNWVYQWHQEQPKLSVSEFEAYATYVLTTPHAERYVERNIEKALSWPVYSRDRRTKEWMESLWERHKKGGAEFVSVHFRATSEGTKWE